MSEKKTGDDKKKENENLSSEKNVKEKSEGPKKQEYYWSFIRVLRDINRYLEGELFPMLRRQGVDDETIAMLAVMMSTKLQEVIISQLAIMKPSVESITSLDAVQEAVNKIYKQYSENRISANEALDLISSIFNILRNKK